MNKSWLKKKKLTINKDMKLKKNTFYEIKDYRKYQNRYKYVRINDIVGDDYMITHFTENFIAGTNVDRTIEDTECFNKEVPKTLQTLCVGDIVVNNECEYKKVLGVVNQKCYIMSDWRSAILKDNEDKCVTSYSVKELEDFGYEPYIEDIEDTEVEELSSREKKDIKSITDYALKMIIDRVEEMKEIRNKN